MSDTFTPIARVVTTADRGNLRTSDGRRGVASRCVHCGKDYVARPPRNYRNQKPGRYCSHDCFHASATERNAELQRQFIHQTDDAAKKVRANGLINKRIKDGMIARPKACERCGKTGRVDACHIDYDRPDVVTFACRSCHMKSHYDPAIDAEIQALAKTRGGPVGISAWKRAEYLEQGGRDVA